MYVKRTTWPGVTQTRLAWTFKTKYKRKVFFMDNILSPPYLVYFLNLARGMIPPLQPKIIFIRNPDIALLAL